MVNKMNVNYTTESKYKSLHHDNYTDDMNRDHLKGNVTCWACIFAGENKHLPILAGKSLCGKYISEVAEVKGCGTCDSGRSRFKWYNRLYAKMMPITTLILKKSGFEYKNR